MTPVIITNNTQYCLLPPQREQHYELRQRVHNSRLPSQSSSLRDSIYFMQMLFKSAINRFYFMTFYHCIRHAILLSIVLTLLSSILSAILM